MSDEVPTRLLEQPSTAEDVRSLLEAGVDVEPPSGLRDALWSRLEPRLGVPPASPPGASNGLWIGVGALVGAGALALGLLANSPDRTAESFGSAATNSPARVPRVASSGEAVHAPSAAASSVTVVRATEARAPSANPPPPATRPIDSGVSLEDLPAAPPKSSVSVPAPPGSSSSSDVGVESQIVQDARAKLRAGDASGALALLADADKRFPRGTLALERTVLRILALDRAGRRGEAAEQAKVFLRAHPDSPHAERLRSLGGSAEK